MTGVAFEEVTGDWIKLTRRRPRSVRLRDGGAPFAGQDVVRATPGLFDEKRYIPPRTPTSGVRLELLPNRRAG